MTTELKYFDLSNLTYKTQFSMSDKAQAYKFAARLMELGKDVTVLHTEVLKGSQHVDVFSDGSIERTLKSQMVTLSGHSRCEACGNILRNHEWADLDEHGFAVWCSERESSEK